MYHNIKYTVMTITYLAFFQSCLSGEDQPRRPSQVYRKLPGGQIDTLDAAVYIHHGIFD